MNREIATSLEIDLSDPEPSKRCKILKNKLKERLNEKERKEFSKHLSEVDEIKRFLGFMEDEENKRMQNQDNLKTEDSTEISIAELNENFVKFSSLLVAEGTFTLIKRIKHEIAKDDTCPTIDVFIEKNKHTLFHLFESKNCCQCETSENNYHKVMSCEQWSCLFKKNTKKCNNSMPADQCCCQFSADSNLDISTLDITLLSLILLHICTLGIDEREEVKKIQMQATRYFDPSSIPYMTNNAYVENFNDTSFALETIGKAIGDEMFLEIKEKIETLEETKVADLCRHLIGLLQLQRKTKGEDMERIETELRQIHKKNRRDSDTSVEDIWSYVPQTKSGNMLFLLCFFIKAFCLLRKTRLLFYK
ncbi:uncharacterized protein LOC134269736 [Saccostrea cucullata]|uniref:uncharacterized protein LOC134269736 n=1 Tax=Saccostrea cuccullata TaxID=36930 RepID=UPI002ED0E14E